jgi:hypothetical protein
MTETELRDRPVRERRITEAMVEADVDAYLNHYADLQGITVDPVPVRRLMVTEVFQRMSEAGATQTRTVSSGG